MANERFKMTKERIKMISCDDDKIFEVDEVVAFQSRALRAMFTSGEYDRAEPVRFPAVSRKSLEKVLEYCKYHVENEKLSANEKNAWDAEFMRVDKDTLLELTKTAKLMRIQKLQELCAETMTRLIAEKQTENMTRSVVDMQTENMARLIADNQQTENVLAIYKPPEPKEK